MFQSLFHFNLLLLNKVFYFLININCSIFWHMGQDLAVYWNTGVYHRSHYRHCALYPKKYTSCRHWNEDIKHDMTDVQTAVPTDVWRWHEIYTRISKRNKSWKKSFTVYVNCLWINLFIVNKWAVGTKCFTYIFWIVSYHCVFL